MATINSWDAWDALKKPRVRHRIWKWVGTLLFVGDAGSCRALVRWDRDAERYGDTSGSWAHPEWLEIL